MTLITGIICKDGVVMASDSQAMSHRGVDVKRMDFTKFFTFDHNLDLKVAISGAGAVPFISKAVEKLKEKATEKRVKTIKELVELAEDTMNELTRRYVIERFKSIGVAKSLKSFGVTRFQGAQEIPKVPLPQVVLMIGGMNGEPTLYIITPEGIAEKEENFASLGTGSAFAEYIFARLHYDEIKVKEGVDLAIYTVEEVKKVDPNIGGDVQVITVTKDGAREVPREIVKERVQKLSRRDELLSQIWQSMVFGSKTEEDVEKFLGASSG